MCTHFDRFCGDWVNNVWVPGPARCAQTTATSTCTDWVKQNPGEFKEAFWIINWMKVWQLDASTDYKSNGNEQPSGGDDDEVDVSTSAFIGILVAIAVLVFAQAWFCR